MIILDYKDRRPIYEQVIEKLQELILRGLIEPGAQLPSVRSLAMELSINPNTIQKAYVELERQGYIFSIKGKGSFVAENMEIKKLDREKLIKQTKSVIKDAKAKGILKEEILKITEEIFD